MAMFDDRRFLLSHINHSFITGDDTGICEMVMLDEDVFKNQHQICLKLRGEDADKPDQRLSQEAHDLNYETDLFESGQGSYDIESEREDYICHRRRSNTAQRLDRLKKDKINQLKTKTIVWRCNSPTASNHSEERLSHDSPTNELNCATTTIYEDGTPKQPEELKIRSKSPPKKSALTRLLERFPSLPKNPFSEYAQFDGGMSEALPVKKIMIFIALTQQQQHQQSPPTAAPSQQLLHITQQPNGVPKNDTSNVITNNHDQSQDSSGIGTMNGSDKAAINTSNTTGNMITTQNNNIIPQSSSTTITTTATTPLQRQPPCISPIKPKNNGPLEVVIVSTARVQDLIGLICWQYTNEGRLPKLHHEINRYCLRIAEDNGEVDPDFTSLNPNEPLSKFNFPSLALTEKTEEKVRVYNGQPRTNGALYIERAPSVSTGVKIANGSSRLSALTRLLFRDAKLDPNESQS